MDLSMLRIILGLGVVRQRKKKITVSEICVDKSLLVSKTTGKSRLQEMEARYKRKKWNKRQLQLISYCDPIIT